MTRIRLAYRALAAWPAVAAPVAAPGAALPVLWPAPFPPPFALPFPGPCALPCPLPFAAALAQWRQLVQAHVFQPKTADAPIQVLGLLEAAGLQFEGTWLCDMGDDRWPPPAAPQPLLPRDWQRRLRMPHCDAEREFAVAQQLSASLRANARQFIVSYQRERDDVPRHVSPLFADIAHSDLAALAIAVEEPFLSLIHISEPTRPY